MLAGARRLRLSRIRDADAGVSALLRAGRVGRVMAKFDQALSCARRRVSRADRAAPRLGTRASDAFPRDDHDLSPVRAAVRTASGPEGDAQLLQPERAQLQLLGQSQPEPAVF